MAVFLVDANVLIAASENDEAVERLLWLAREGKVELSIPPKAEAEVYGGIPDEVRRWSPPSQVPVSAGRRMQGLEAYIHKEFGGEDGSRKEPSEADKELVQAAVSDPKVSGIITRDPRDIEHLMYELESSARVRIYNPKMVVERYS